MYRDFISSCVLSDNVEYPLYGLNDDVLGKVGVHFFNVTRIYNDFCLVLESVFEEVEFLYNCRNHVPCVEDVAYVELVGKCFQACEKT